MKNLLSTVFLFFIITNVSGQSPMYLLAHVIKTKSLKGYQNVIVAEMETSVAEFTLRHLKTNQKVFTSIDTSKATITLTSKEKKFILQSFKEQNLIHWTSEDFHNIKVIKQEEVSKYAKENRQNGYIYISAPVFIRDGSIALVFFANFYGTVENGGGSNDLSFYKLQNGNWKKWITLEAGTYN